MIEPENKIKSLELSRVNVRIRSESRQSRLSLFSSSPIYKMQAYQDEDQDSNQNEYEGATDYLLTAESRHSVSCRLPESQFNNGRGLAVALSFLALPLPPKAGTKRRANAKAIVENHLLHIHENATLTDLLDKAINSITGQGKPLLYGIGNRTGSLSPNNFTVKYTIARTEYKDISIESLQDHSTLIDTIKELNRPAGGFKLIITEHKVC